MSIFVNNRLQNKNAQHITLAPRAVDFSPSLTATRFSVRISPAEKIKGISNEIPFIFCERRYDSELSTNCLQFVLICAEHTLFADKPRRKWEFRISPYSPKWAAFFVGGRDYRVAVREGEKSTARGAR